nr:carboxypeptidase-like regulatory domain-containing protein [Parapedobacter sp. ISTM3]
MFPLVTFSQFRIITGIVSDESGAPLGRANVMAKALGEDGNVKFAMANAQGQYNFTLDASKAYLLSVSYIGYHPDSTKLDPSNSNLRHDFKLRTKNEQLTEIIIEHEYRPVIIKKDTIVFNVEAFAAGNERKLKDVLGKLPGVEVDRDGRVTFNGQPSATCSWKEKNSSAGAANWPWKTFPPMHSTRLRSSTTSTRWASSKRSPARMRWP